MEQLQQLDWIVLIGTLLFIVVYGIWKSRGQQNIDSYLLGDKQAKWWMVGLSVMATQASAITFLSTPGQAYADGMQFVQFYFGMPIAMVILCITFIPIYYRLKVYTAYEYLETRFDIKTRLIAAFLFLIQRGLGAGITIYAPAIILTTIMGWSLRWTTLIIGSLVILYTVSGGSKAVNQTQKLQMVVIMGGMFVVFMVLLNYIPDGWSFSDALHLAGENQKMNVIDTSIDLNNRYTVFFRHPRQCLFIPRLFWYRSKSGPTLSDRQKHRRKPYGIALQWAFKNPYAIFYSACWRDGFHLLPVSPGSDLL